MSYEVIVIGLGGMGSAAAYRLAQRGKKMLGLEKFTPRAHAGFQSRRIAYHAAGLLRGPRLRSAAAARTRDVGPDRARQRGARLPPRRRRDGRQAGQQDRPGQPHERHSGRGSRRTGKFSAGPSQAGREGGCRAAFRGTRHALGTGRVATAKATYEAEDIVVCPGAWAPHLLRDLDIPFEIARQVQYFWTPADDFSNHPIYIWDRDEGAQFYGFPLMDGAVKVAFFRGGRICPPETIDRTVPDHEVQAMADFSRPKMPGLAGTFQLAATCMHANTADEHLVIATHAKHDNVTVARGFSGHGFKFVPVVGEILAAFAVEDATRHLIALSDPARLRGRAWLAARSPCSRAATTPTR